MRKDSFEEKYPGYEIIPMKRSWLKGPLTWLIALAALIGLPGYMLYMLSKAQVPMPNMVGVNKFTLGTLGNVAISQSQSGKHQEAVKNFSNYFRLGGTDSAAMVAFATSLDAIGESDLARLWAKKATEADPESRAARFTRDALEQKRGSAK